MSKMKLSAAQQSELIKWTEGDVKQDKGRPHRCCSSVGRASVSRSVGKACLQSVMAARLKNTSWITHGHGLL